LGPQPTANHVVVDQKRARRPSLISWPVPERGQRAVRHTDCGNIQFGTKMQRQPRSARMITSRRVE
jgi:hypothetical protein